MLWLSILKYLIFNLFMLPNLFISVNNALVRNFNTLSPVIIEPCYQKYEIHK